MTSALPGTDARSGNTCTIGSPDASCIRSLIVQVCSLEATVAA